MIRSLVLFTGLLIVGCLSCKKSSPPAEVVPPPATTFAFDRLLVNGSFNGFSYKGVNQQVMVTVFFRAKMDRNTVRNAVSFRSLATVDSVPLQIGFQQNDSAITISNTSPLSPLTTYQVAISKAIKSTSGATLQAEVSVRLTTAIDSSNKFPVITDSALLTKVQQQTFKYFWDFGHPISGLARERNTSGDIVTTGGSGFGIMSTVVAVNRGFISRGDALTRLQTMVSFLKNTAQKFHGAFPHWLNGATGVVVPFSTRDNGADLVETSFLMEGLLTARQYFNGTTAAETNLRADINSLWRGVEWDWFRMNNENVLYWHWSPNYAWDMNLPIKGWNECLVTYVLAAASPAHSVPRIVYDNGFASNGSFVNGNTYYGNQLPLGPQAGGPLFFAHYSFLGINPNSLTDAYANYQTQTVNHSKINYQYCVNNPSGYYGYSSQCWGLTASDIRNGYTASSPTNDVGVIAPTAAISSLPYTPTESMNALRFFYYKLGDKIWGDYGFKDAFSLDDLWFADSYLAIDQGPQIVMIENYRTGLLWNLFMSCPEIKTGMVGLGFSSPHL